jgi:anti-sigma28 factor (negative regulator of flagellin synthesis)
MVGNGIKSAYYLGTSSKPPNSNKPEASDQMKILPGPQPVLQAAEVVETKNDQASTAAKRKAVTKPSVTADKVDFSATLSAGLKVQQVQQAKRLESIKAQLATGTYQVSSRQVAEKMLSDMSDF